MKKPPIRAKKRVFVESEGFESFDLNAIYTDNQGVAFSYAVFKCAKVRHSLHNFMAWIITLKLV